MPADIEDGWNIHIVLAEASFVFKTGQADLGVHQIAHMGSCCHLRMKTMERWLKQWAHTVVMGYHARSGSVVNALQKELVRF